MTFSHQQALPSRQLHIYCTKIMQKEARRPGTGNTPRHGKTAKPLQLVSCQPAFKVGSKAICTTLRPAAAPIDAQTSWNAVLFVGCNLIAPLPTGQPYCEPRSPNTVAGSNTVCRGLRAASARRHETTASGAWQTAACTPHPLHLCKHALDLGDAGHPTGYISNVTCTLRQSTPQPQQWRDARHVPQGLWHNLAAPPFPLSKQSPCLPVTSLVPPYGCPCPGSQPSLERQQERPALTCSQVGLTHVHQAAGL